MDRYVGKRVYVREALGTICYYGPVNGSSGNWLGIDWDDENRGKHDGSKDGKRYFSTRSPTSGSFLRLSAQANFGRAFLSALVEKYVESLHGSKPESIVLGSSNGSIQVEAVNLDKIRAKFSNLSRLKEISLYGELVSSAGDDADKILETCSNVHGLDLSKTLLGNWIEISRITTRIPTLQRLSLNQNRLASLSGCDTTIMHSGFQRLQELQLNGTLIDWDEMQCITAHMPVLHSLELGYNLLQELRNENVPSKLAPLTSINFDSNALRDWTSTLWTTRSYESLERVILSSNGIISIPKLPDSGRAVRNLKHISLAHNQLADWDSIDNIPVWCPSLESASLTGNPIVVDPETAKAARSLIVAKIPTLLALDGTAISPLERDDSELYYLSYVAAQQHRRPPESYPQWDRLREKHNFGNDVKNDGQHGSSAAISTTQPTPVTLGSHLFGVNLHTVSLSENSELFAFSSAIIQDAESESIRVLPTMKLKVLRLKITKTLRKHLTLHHQTIASLWLRMNDDTLSELDHTRDGQDLSWIGIEDSSDLVVVVKNT